MFLRSFGIVIFALVFTTGCVNGQRFSTEDWIESILANGEGEGELDLNTILEQIHFYEERPLDLNKATREDLLSLYFLTDLEVNAILEHRNKHGNFLSVLELQSIELLQMDKILLLRELVTTRVNTTSKEFISSSRKEQSHELYTRFRRILEQQAGFRPDATSPFLGDPNRYYLRYKYNAGQKIQVGMTAEKDAGEEFFRGTNPYGFDFYSAHFQFKDVSPIIRQVIIGDYTISFGQGLTAFMGFGAGKSTQVMRVKNPVRPLRPYTSVSEFNFLRGAAVEINLSRNWNAVVFGSSRKRDANTMTDTLENDIDLSFSSLPLDGFHRTANEIGRKHQLQLTDGGASIRYQRGNFQLDFNTIRSQFDGLPGIPDEAYRLYSAPQSAYWNNGISYSYIKNNLNFFGEIAVDRQWDPAFLHGMIMALDKNFEVALVYRNIRPEYQSLYASAFTESTLPQNETGLYVSSVLRLNKNLQIHGYADLFRHPWLRFRINSPSHGREYFIKIQYIQKRKSETYLQFFFEEKEQTLTSEAVIRPVLPISRTRVRLHHSYRLVSALELRNRLEYSFFTQNGKTDRGFMMYQDLIYRPPFLPFSASFRYAIFDIDNFNSRIYAYENDILYEFSIPAYFNRGIRTYLNLRYRLNSHITIEGRIAQTYLNDENTIGSGVNEISGNKRTDVKAQIRYKF